jgi:hypothetical protein
MRNELLLNKIADKDCTCEDKPPYKRCPACIAAHALSEVGEILDEAVRELEALNEKESRS